MMALWAIAQRWSAAAHPPGSDGAGYPWDEAAPGPDRLVSRRRS